MSAKEIIINIENLSAWYGNVKVLKNINISVLSNTVTAIIGPSGCGKTTFVRCINRLHELSPDSRIEGKILLSGNNIYEMDAMKVRHE
ncbi:MAG TPA: ATP-binding cassette domain-containing protein, partial [Caldisericia bacterium]|nr:ATP-binding cassette domain-containing protein [Caldisericia bacterium]